MSGTFTVDESDSDSRFDLSAATSWQALVLRDGRPAARVDLARPGDSLRGPLLTAAVHRWADWEVARDQLARRLDARLGMPAPAPPPPLRCSVIVCTHRRHQDVTRLLGTLTELDPAPDEILVVDNDPGERDCQAAVEAAGYRYLREDRRGLDNARNAGLAAAGGDLIAFIDDDCVAPPAWLARLATEFADPNLAALTGPAFPHLLDTPARRRMERQASLARGLRRVEFDWTTFPVAGAGAIGVGANMAFRRDALTSLGPRPFPPELDAGTASESGGDTYVIARLLALGHRVVYDPSTFVYHRHRGDSEALHRAFFGYGVGLSAALTRLLVHDRELSTPQTWMWLVSQYRQTQQRRLAGRADRVETRLAWDFLRGGLIGALRWRQALREAAPSERLGAAAIPAPREEPATAPTAAATTAGADAAAPAISVVVPTSGRPEALDRCLAALAAQDSAEFEVVLVDDSPTPAAIDPAHGERVRLRVIHSGGQGAAAARNAGAAAALAPLLLFLDDDIVAAPDLVRRHRERHDAEPEHKLAVVGAYPPRPRRPSLISRAAALWWNDLFSAMRQAHVPTYAGALTGNLSITAAAFAESGSFDTRFGRYRREDWEWGLRALKLGFALRYEPAARGEHEFVLDTPGRLNAARLEGYGDALLLQQHPDAGAAVIPLVIEPPTAGLKPALWRRTPIRAAAVRLLAALEWGNLRLSWVRLFNLGQRLEYERGVSEAGLPAAGPEPLLKVDLDSTAAIPAPTVAAPTVSVRVGGAEVARVRPALGQWGPGLSEQILTATPWPALERAALATGCFPERDESHDQAAHTLVIDDLGDRGWQGVIAAAVAARGSELVAVRMPGVGAEPGWLEQALVGFEGEGVGVILGRGLPDGAPPVPLALHGRGESGESVPCEAELDPHYLVFRRALLPALIDAARLPGFRAPVQALVTDALEGGWTVGYRDIQELRGEPARGFEAGLAGAAEQVSRAPRPGRAAAAELRRATAVLAWHLLRRRGRRLAVETYAGTLLGVASPGRPRRIAQRIVSKAVAPPRL
ncbi:MAG TPA: glycosyltransferase [Solirubrobacterales bacterium]|jgi:GT2 family glycosyltransferase|nr:glycosyltransferase [Solirubrobacterales bacterium]